MKYDQWKVSFLLVYDKANLKNGIHLIVLVIFHLKPHYLTIQSKYGSKCKFCSVHSTPLFI